ncbi:MAG: hypothetical protein JJD92_04730 [Frankiaceae bacterium]|nr:hypothetical protein [Frankiaceae bacterium]
MSLAAAPSGTAGPLGLLVVLLIGVALVLLIRNMNGRLRRLPPSFDDPKTPNSNPNTRNDEDDSPQPPSP